MTHYYDKDGITIYNADCREALPSLASDSVDSVVTDPPAGIGFMGKTWDNPKGYGYTDGGNRVGEMPASATRQRNPSCRKCGGRKRAGPKTKPCVCDDGPDWNTLKKALEDRQQFIDFMSSVMVECLRVLKPGGHMLCWAIPRTSHWTATAIEDAGFEIRDCIYHVFGSGFPKSLDVSKAIDKAAGAEREVVGSKLGRPGMAKDGCNQRNGFDSAFGGQSTGPMSADITAPATDDAKQWSGWGTALKPAVECWWLCRKPLIGTVVENVLQHGTGAINVDGCRVPLNGDYKCGANGRPSQTGLGDNYDPDNANQHSDNGRWPANLMWSHHPECNLIGTETIKGNGHWPAARPSNATECGPQGHTGQENLDERHAVETVEKWDCHPDCPSRLFPQSDGQQGDVRGTEQSRTGGDGTNCYGEFGRIASEKRGDSGSASRFFYCAKASKSDRGRSNDHPTVKPVELMEYLVRLITPPGGIVLDPFMGSGTTLQAAKYQGFKAIGIEQEEKYCKIAMKRIVQGVLPIGG